jgi:hypothetical protein
VIPDLGVHLVSTVSPSGGGFIFAELVFGPCWLCSLALPLRYGLRLSRRPTARDLFTPFPSGEWFRFTFKLLLPIELGLGLAITLGLDGRVAVLAKIVAWLLTSVVTVVVVARGLRRAPRADSGDGSPRPGNEVPSYEQGYAQTIADIEDSIAPIDTATRRRGQDSRER